MQIGKGLVRREGKDVCLLAYGSSVNEALMAAELLEKSGVSTTVIDARFCKPLDTVSPLLGGLLLQRALLEWQSS